MGGPLEDQPARLDAGRRRRQQIEAERRRLQGEQDRTDLRQLDADFGRLRTLVHAALLAGGYRQHRRQWVRVQIEGDDMTTAIATVPSEVEVRALVERCNTEKPARQDLAALRAYLATTPDAPLRAIGAGAVQSSIIAAQGVGPAQEIVIVAEVERMRDSFGYADAPPIERGLIDHILTCWLRMQFAEMTLNSKTSGTHTPQGGVYWERRLDAAQRRYLRAMATLAKLRQLLPAHLQVNIAHGPQQVNNTFPTE